MKTKEFNKLRVGQSVYRNNGAYCQVSKINRTTKRVDLIGGGSNIYWRFLHMRQPKNATSGLMCGSCGDYHIVEKMEFPS